MAGEPRTMNAMLLLQEVEALEEQAALLAKRLALLAPVDFDAVDARDVTTVLDDPARWTFVGDRNPSIKPAMPPEQAERVAWRCAVQMSANHAVQLQALGDFIRRRSGIDRPGPLVKAWARPDESKPRLPNVPGDAGPN